MCESGSLRLAVGIRRRPATVGVRSCEPSCVVFLLVKYVDKMLGENVDDKKEECKEQTEFWEFSAGVDRLTGMALSADCIFT